MKAMLSLLFAVLLTVFLGESGRSDDRRGGATDDQDAAESQAPDSVRDLLRVTPEELRGTATQDFLAQAQAAYNDRRFEDAARAFIEVIRRDPDDSVSLYNLACCYALIGAPEPAARFLKAAWEAGFHDMDHIDQDHDFDSVRTSEPFQSTRTELAKDLAERQKLRGEQFDVVIPTVQSARVLKPEGLTEGARVPLIVALHGAGDSSDRFVRLFADECARRHWILCLPEAQYAIPSPVGLGYLWYRSMDDSVSYELSDRFILAAIDSVLKHTPEADPQQVFVTGFSQGGFLSYTLGLTHPERFHGVIPIGAGVNPDDFSDRGDKGGWPSFLICHSPEDRVIPWPEYQASAEFLTRKGIAFDSYGYQGGHTVNPALADTVLAWVERKIKEPRKRRVVPMPEGVRID